MHRTAVTRGLSRRGMLALASLAGVSGCVGQSYDDKIAKDRYIAIIKHDPMFSWTPPGGLTRVVSFVPPSDGPLAAPWSVVDVVFSGSDASSTPELVKLAHATSLLHGYNEAGRRTADGITIFLSVQAEAGDRSFSLYFKAPVS